MSAKKPSKKDEIVKDVVDTLRPEITKAVNNQIAPIHAEIASMKKDLIAEIKEMQKTAPTPATAPSGTISIGGQTLDLSNLAGEIQKVLPNVDAAQLKAAISGMAGNSTNAGAAGNAAAAPAAPITIGGQQVNMAGLQALMQVLSMFGVLPNQQQNSGAGWLQEATYRNMLDDMAFGSMLKRTLIAKAAKGLDLDLSGQYAAVNDKLIQEPLKQITGLAQNQNAESK